MSRYVDSVIADLAAGRTIQNYREGGTSMTPRIQDGQKQTLVPVPDLGAIEIGDIVLCRVRGNTFTHLVKKIRRKKGKLEFQIGNNHGHINGWTRRIFGKSVAVYW
jgi:SOS-response transcriptional repressor LexA